MEYYVLQVKIMSYYVLWCYTMLYDDIQYQREVYFNVVVYNDIQCDMMLYSVFNVKGRIQCYTMSYGAKLWCIFTECPDLELCLYTGQ